MTDSTRAGNLWYEDFSQTTDEEVRELLLRANQEIVPAAEGSRRAKAELRSQT
jgi:predicted phosphoribosyltransferase